MGDQYRQLILITGGTGFYRILSCDETVGDKQGRAGGVVRLQS